MKKPATKPSQRQRSGANKPVLRALAEFELKPPTQSKLRRWIATRVQEVLVDDKYDLCEQLAQKLLESYCTPHYSMGQVQLAISEALARSQTMTGKINLYTPAMRMLRAHELANQLLLCAHEEKCVAVVQALTEF